MNENLKTIARINDVEIQIVGNGEKRVPIKPICEALGIDESVQRKKLQSDEFLSSVTVLSAATGSDGKDYKMTTIPHKYIFGWLFTINPKNVKPEAKEAVMKYRMECYDALFNHFTEQSEYLEEKQQIIDHELDEYQKIQVEFKTAKKRMEQQKIKVDKARKLTIEDWKETHFQGVLDFPDANK